MNGFKRAALAASIFAGLALAATGCTQDKELLRAQAQAETRASELGIARAQADAEESRAVQRLADKIDAGGATAYLVSKALTRGGVVGGTSPAPAPVVSMPMNPVAALFQAVLQTADVALRAYGIKAGRDVAIASTNAQRDTAIASYGAFTSMGSAIATAGTAGYPYIQAPAANVTTTLSGTGVLGSGTYTGPVTTTTTTRTCPGGTAAAGGNGAGTAGGGAGGTAPGGTC
jgi:hypothetical protein